MSASTCKASLIARVVAFAATLAGAQAAQGSPFFVDSTGTAEDIELKSSFEYRDTTSKQTLVAPKFAVAFPLGPNLEFEVGSSYRRIERGGATHEGLADSTLEVKWRLMDESNDRVALALVPELSLPTGSERAGLGSGHAALVLPLVVEKHIGAVMLTGEFGYARSLGGDEEYFPLGVLLTAKPSDTLKVGIELAGEAPRDHFSDCALSTDLGFKWKAARSVELHGLVGRTVRSPDSEPMTRFKLVVEMHF